VSRRRWPLLIVAPALAGEVLTLWSGLRHERFSSILQTECVAVALFAVALLGMLCYTGRRGLLVVLAGGLLLQLAALGAHPSSSDDVYRYVWDGKVQLAGIDPYRYPPSATELDRLRGDTLFYTAPNARARAKCAWRLPDDRCSEVNRPDVHTIYPPVAEAAFTLARMGSFGRSDGPFPLQVLAAIGAMAASMLLALWARAQRRPAWQVAVWAWCPVTAVELGNNGHIDWLAALTAGAAIFAYKRRRPVLAGGLLGAAIATKLYPALILPAMLRKHPWRVIGAATGLVLLSYLPHVAAVGGSVIGYLPGYLKEEDYTNGGRFLLLAKVVPHFALTVAAVVCLLLAAWWAARRSDPSAPEHAALIMVGVGLLVATPSYSWYAVLLLVLVAMTGHVEWLPLVIAPTIASLGAHLFGNGVDYRTSCYAVGLVAAVAGELLRARLVRSSPAGRTGVPAI
jgi:alpha-1,2-mannosyltransferase